ncbi:kinase-like domain-containing protein [Rhizophagus clarus]|uniref:Kinase-like domain-containing protein n=1 Tax=Rhizophagus clarus TaxID=94130 RepID=A0A8H3M4R7_9GLOM|nr:kinase-like domain-containing protein [Rhizophagus clarus]
MEIFNKTSKEKRKLKLYRKLLTHVAISSINSEEIDDRIISMEDIGKEKKRFKENFKNSWTSGNEDIDELIQYSQLNVVYYQTCLEWFLMRNFIILLALPEEALEIKSCLFISGLTGSN